MWSPTKGSLPRMPISRSGTRSERGCGRTGVIPTGDDGYAHMKVIFLDIDGVLNCRTTKNPRDFPYFIDRRLVRHFKNLVRRTLAKVVLSSSWRIDPVGLHAARHFGIPICNVCPDMPNKPRSAEIRA